MIPGLDIDTAETLRTALRPWVHDMARHIIHLSLTGLPATRSRHTFPDRMLAPIRPALDLMLGLSCTPSNHPEDTPISIVRSESGRVIYDLLIHEIDLILIDEHPAVRVAVRRNIPIIMGQTTDIGLSALDLWLTTHTNNRPGGITPWGGDPKFGLAAAAGALPDMTPERLATIILSVIPERDPTP